MICPDCEFEVEKLNKSGICKDCAKRMATMKYKKKDYVKLKDIKGTKEYNMAIGHRNVKRKKVEEKQDINNKIKKLDCEVNSKELAKGIVEKDIEDRINKLRLNKNTLNLPLEFVLESFVRIFNKDIVKQKTMLKNEYEVFITDRLHRLLYTEDLDEISQIALEQKYIEEKRTELKKELNLYAPFEELIEELCNDDIFKTKLNLAIEKYENVKNSYKNCIYVSNTLSMQDLDFTVKSRNNVVERKLAERRPLKRFYASVPCNNLYGNPGKTLFEANGGIIAENEQIAKQRLKEILKSFNGIFYNDKDIVIKEFSLEKE